MPFVPASSNYSPQVEAILQKGHRLPLGALISLFISHQAFDLVSEQAAD
jgi:hypothetical protein